MAVDHELYRSAARASAAAAAAHAHLGLEAAAATDLWRSTTEERKEAEEVDIADIVVLELVSREEVSGILELENVWVFVQLIYRPMRTTNQLYQKPKHCLTPGFLIPCVKSPDKTD